MAVEGLLDIVLKLCAAGTLNKSAHTEQPPSSFRPKTTTRPTVSKFLVHTNALQQVNHGIRTTELQ